MNEHKISLRQQAFINYHSDEKLKIVKGSRAWLNTQEMLKRSGRTCVPELFPELKKTSSGVTKKIISNNHTFNFDSVKHLYSLFSAIFKMKKIFPPSFTLEITTMKGDIKPWPYNLIIVPKNIRRKADAFMQNIPEYQGGKERKRTKSGLTGSLYKTMLSSCKDKKILHAKLESLIVYSDSTDSIDIYPAVAAGILKNSPTVYSLFLFESVRLNNLPQRIKDVITKHRQDDAFLERLANVLFFGLVYQDNDENIFFSFSHNTYIVKYKNIQHDGREVYAKRHLDNAGNDRVPIMVKFINDVYERYIISSDERRKIRVFST